MYYVSSITDTLRVPPDRFDQNLSSILLDLARDSLEGKIFPDLGYIVSVMEAEEIGKGKLIPQDGGAFYPCNFKVLSYKPERGEIVEGKVNDITSFGIFLQVSTIQPLCHISQVGNDHFRYDDSANRLIGKDTQATVDVGEMVRGRIIVVGVQKKAIRVGITMRQPGLGTKSWIEEWKESLIEKRQE